MKFKLNGKPLSVTPTPRVVRVLKEFLSKLPSNELLSTKELGSKLGYSPGNLSGNVTSRPEMRCFIVKVRFPHIMTLWGNKKTITALRKHKEILA